MTQAIAEEVDTPLSEDDTAQYLKDIRRYPLLTPEQELEVAKGCARGDEEAIRTMVNSNLRLVVYIAKEYVGKGVPLLDLIQEGSIGLLSAAKKFDHTRECRFAHYASQWIHQGCYRGVLKHSSLIRVPLHTLEKMRKILAVKAALMQESGEEPSIEELAARCEMTAEKVSELLEQLPQVGSIDIPTGENGDDTLQSLLKNAQAPQPEESLVREELKHIMEGLLQKLTDRQQQILRLRFGMDDGVCYSLQQVAQRIGLSKERTRQIESQAIDKLKKLSAGLGLEGFLA